MTDIVTTIYGKKEVLSQTAGHYIGAALDEFIVAEYPDTILGSTMTLSIGLEIYVKNKLEEIDPVLISTNMNWGKWKKFRRSIYKDTPADRETKIIAELKNHGIANRKIDFARAIETFHLVKPMSLTALKDLKRLRDYRNGLFHWKAKTAESFTISKWTIRIFNWLFKTIEDDIGHYLGGEFSVIDPDHQKRKKLKKLQRWADEDKEMPFVVMRRQYKHLKNYQIYHQVKARLEGVVHIPDAVVWDEQCPVCEYRPLEVYESGTKRDGEWEERYVFAHCKRCDFACSDQEFEAFKSPGSPSLIAIFEGDC